MWREFQAQINEININIDNVAVEKSFPFSKYVHISIHSPNNLSDLDSSRGFNLIDIKQLTSLKYSEHRIQRLGKGYDTDCYSYDSDTNFSYYRMRSDCVNECYQDKMRKLCNVDRGILMSFSLIRREYFVNRSEKILSCYRNLDNFQFKQHCEKICKVECNFKHYPLEIEKTSSLNNKIRIIHNEFPDIFVKHIPEMNLIDFVCNFGGLLGMWLGLSLFGIFNDIFDTVTKINYMKYLIRLKSNYNCLKVYLLAHINFLIVISKRFVRNCVSKILSMKLLFIKPK